MIPPPIIWWSHYLFDVLAWASAWQVGKWQYRRWPREVEALAPLTPPSYFVTLALGAVAGAWLLGSANSLNSVISAPSHSVAGALAGGIVAVEIWKAVKGVRGSTGKFFALPIATGIAVGRLGCFFSGILDFTYGIPTNVPWAVDFGDGMGRHPVQLYEALTMAGFAIVLARSRAAGARWANEHAFHALVLVYAGQRFLWEFLKPYPTVLGPLNIFHLLMLGLAAYAIIWWRRDEPASALR